MDIFALRMISALLAAGLFFPGSGYSQTSNGIWITAAELASLPMSGPAWNALKAQADASTGTPDLGNQDSEQQRQCPGKGVGLRANGN